MENEQEPQFCAKCPTPDKCAEANKCVLSAREPNIDQHFLDEVCKNESIIFPDRLLNWCECTICTDHEDHES